MTECEPTHSFTAVLRRAERLTEARGEAAVTSTHLLLAVMAQFDSPWPVRIVERGGLNFRHALRRLGWKGVEKLERAAETEACMYRASMRLMVVVFVASGLRLLLLRRTVAGAEPRPSWDLGACEAVALAERLPTRARPRGGRRPEMDVGHLLLALSSSPGSHLRLLDNSTVLACAVRRDLNLAAWHHRLVLACDRANLQLRRLRMRLDREMSSHGRFSLWGLAWLGNCAAGLLVAAGVFPITVLANLFLYFFLWPSALLMTGLRALCGMTVGCQTRSHRWHEIPGGEVGLVGANARMSDRRLATLFLAPRILAFLCSIAALVVVAWGAERLGVVAFPTLFARPDIATGAASESFWLTPLVLFTDMQSQHGAFVGIGLLAGLGASLMSLPTYRELALIRLYAGHEVGLGSRLARYLTLPASILTGAIACIEAVLPFRNGPIYLTVYVVPAIFSLFIAGTIVALLPY